MSEKKKGVILLAFGGAENLDMIEPFLKNILKGRPVTPELLERTIDRYRLIGGKSPLLDITRAQAAAIEEGLAKAGAPSKVYVGMRYWHPYIRETLAEMDADGVEAATAVVMAPFSSPVATGAYEKDVEAALENCKTLKRVEFVSNWHVNPAFIKTHVDSIKEALSGFKNPEDVLVIFSNHSLPHESLEGDAYEMKIAQAVTKITRSLDVDHRVAYQSQGAKVFTWLGPKVEDVLEQASKQGKKGVIIVPLGFAADHVETLYDIDILFKELAETKGLVFKRTPSLNTQPLIMEMLTAMIKTSNEILA